MQPFPPLRKTGETYSRALELCQELGETELLISVLSGLSTPN